jgi:hypothetical protein
MASSVAFTVMPLLGTAWTGTAPGDPGTQTVSGTITSTTDMSTWTKKATFGPKFDTVEFTNFGSNGYKAFKPGLFEADINFELNQDFAASQVDVTIATQFFARTNPVYIDLKPTSSGRSTTNPSIVVAGFWVDYPMEYTVGDAMGANVGFKVTGAVARLTS